jgi:hypothetical protein
MEKELVKTKEKMGDIINVLMENCSSEILDRVYAAMNLQIK